MSNSMLENFVDLTELEFENDIRGNKRNYDGILVNPPVSPNKYGSSLILITLTANNSFYKFHKITLRAGLSPTDLLNEIKNKRSDIENVLFIKIKEIFQIKNENYKLSSANFNFKLKTVGLRARQVYEQKHWTGGPLQLLIEPESGWVEPLYDDKGRSYHIIELCVDLLPLHIHTL